ncbi:MAG: DUF2066 domain-containing protein, partial [Lysobacteraceae bacterium]
VAGAMAGATWPPDTPAPRAAGAGGADGAAEAHITGNPRRGAAPGPPGTSRVLITGIDSADDYVRLMAHLQELSVVRKARPVRATAEGLLLDLDLISGLPGFRRMVADRGVLVAPATDDQDAPPPEGGESVIPTFDLR